MPGMNLLMPCVSKTSVLVTLYSLWVGTHATEMIFHLGSNTYFECERCIEMDTDGSLV